MDGTRTDCKGLERKGCRTAEEKRELGRHGARREEERKRRKQGRKEGREEERRELQMTEEKKE